ncbi:hypothetical protein GQ53DRAFT_143881 [Thozetella sp. PMI_491]|nr:hypothetical protein GQ53DRAFT_143881 [Thozetella sp. PMI_491]
MRERSRTDGAKRPGPSLRETLLCVLSASCLRPSCLGNHSAYTTKSDDLIKHSTHPKGPCVGLPAADRMMIDKITLSKSAKPGSRVKRYSTYRAAKLGTYCT